MSSAAVTLAIAVIGLGLAVASLVWQAATFVLSGARVRVELRVGAHDGLGRIVSGPAGSFDVSLPSRQGFDNQIIGAEVRNVGRMAVSIESFAVVFSNKMAFSHPGNGLGPDLPFRLEPQSSASWFLDLDPVRSAVAVSGSTFGSPDPDAVRVRVELGNGKSVVSSESFAVPGS